MERKFSEKAKHTLCRAHLGHRDISGNRLYVINRAIEGWGQKIDRCKDMKELANAKLIGEWFTPWAPLSFLTSQGEAIRRAWRKELGYDD